MPDLTAQDITAGISCKGNIRALCLCLSSVINAQTPPGKIQVRLEGQFPGINDFYLEQLTDLALLRGVEIKFTICQSTGVRDSRDWQLQNCSTEWLWLLDDDVVPDFRCLTAYLYHLVMRVDQDGPGDPKFSFLAGSKCDVNNRRNYPCFSLAPAGKEAITKTANHSLVYDIPTCWTTGAPAKSLDTGNCFLNIPKIRAKGCTFRQFSDHRNSSGDGTTFWLALEAAGLIGYFAPSAAAYHLEKPGGGFNEFEARGEMLLRLCDVKGWNKDSLKKNWMPGTW